MARAKQAVTPARRAKTLQRLGDCLRDAFPLQDNGDHPALIQLLNEMANPGWPRQEIL